MCISTWRMLAWSVGLVAIVGCGPEKELPKEVNISSASSSPEITPHPTTSDPAAVALVDKCIKAATDGHIERLEKGKESKSTAKGEMRNRDGRFAPASRDIQAVWPDRFWVEHSFDEGEIRVNAIGLRRPVIWAQNVYGDGRKEAVGIANPLEYEGILGTDAIGQHWLPGLVPLADARAIAYAVKKELAGTRPANTVKIFFPGCPVFTLWFDEESSLLGRIAYTHLEGRTNVQKLLVLSGHKAQSGVQLPTTISSLRNDIEVERWSAIAWEFVDKIDDGIFDPPK